MSQETAKTKRPPVVVVMGHVDHGKTTLLDFIRKSNVAAREAGGITQGVGAYEIVHTGQKITFIDTPGHAAFSKMRERGAKIADIAILVVAADDGFQVQTKEALAAIRAAKLPFIVAINKIDKNNADVARAKTELLQNQVLLEGMGGDIGYQAVSAKTGEGVNDLLDLILLNAEVEGWTYDATAPASGFVLEAKLDHRTGPVITLIIKNGTLKTGDELVAGEAGGKAKEIKNFLGEKVSSLSPSSPAVILGFETLPKVGEPFTVGKLSKKTVPVRRTLAAADNKNINVIIKANVAGGLEALSDAISKLKAPDGSKIVIFDQGVGDVTDGDAKLAGSTKSLLVAFKVKINPAAHSVIKAQHVPLFESEIIYELLESLEKYLKAQQHEIVTGELEILAVFDQKNLLKQIVGGKIIGGIIKNQADIEIQRRGKVIASGKIVNLQQGHKNVQEAPMGVECGLLVNAEATIAPGDHIISHAE